MFNNEIDVAAIMQEIKKNAMPEIIEENGKGEVTRITEFIQNTQENSEEHINIGYVLPEVSSKHWSITRKIVTFIYRVIRKLSRFITNDQIIVNKNNNACIKALVEREDAMAKKFEDEIIQLKADIEREDAIAKKYEDEIIQLKADKVTLECRLKELAHEQTQENRVSELLHEKILEGDISFFDEMYLEFENVFRGSSEEISSRLDFYIEKYIKKKDWKNDSIAIDLGCGRGEWIEKVKGLGIQAIGIDTNADMVRECKKKGLQAVECDAIEYLKGMEDNSVSIISAFQVIEHISKDELVQLVKESYRVLKKTGILILETPNICNIEVGASSFYLDPTHKNHVHPEFLQFVAKYIGYDTTEITYWKETETEKWLQSVMQQDETEIMDSAVFRTIFETMKKVVYSSPDYALVAEK